MTIVEDELDDGMTTFVESEDPPSITIVLPSAMISNASVRSRISDLLQLNISAAFDFMLAGIFLQKSTNKKKSINQKGVKFACPHCRHW